MDRAEPGSRYRYLNPRNPHHGEEVTVLLSALGPDSTWKAIIRCPHGTELVVPTSCLQRSPEGDQSAHR